MLMKLLSKNKLKEKFWSGETTTEEDALIKKLTDVNSAEKAYFSFVSQSQKIPENLEKDIWDTIKNRRSLSKRLLFKWAVAASVVVAISLTGFIKIHQRKVKLENQFSIIEQTMHHVSYELTNTHTTDVIYEDNFIVIVAEN